MTFDLILIPYYTENKKRTRLNFAISVECIFFISKISYCHSSDAISWKITHELPKGIELVHYTLSNSLMIFHGIVSLLWK